MEEDNFSESGEEDEKKESKDLRFAHTDLTGIEINRSVFANELSKLKNNDDSSLINDK